MSTRSTTHFVDKLGDPPKAIIYRHADGYPTGAGADIYAFLKEVAENVQDTRFDDASYLAAKYVVFLAREFSVDYDFSVSPMVTKPKASPLDFLSVGVMQDDPGDIEYRYTIVSALHSDLPSVYVDMLDGKGPQELRPIIDAELAEMSASK